MSAPRGQRFGRAFCALAIGFISIVSPRLVHAEPSSIVVFGTKNTLSTQIHAELAALGFRVLLVEVRGAAHTLEDVRAAAREADAVAAVYVVVSATGAEVWLIDRVTGKTLSREVARRDPLAAEENRIVAVRVVELLRASLLELELPDQTRGEKAATPLLRAVAGLPNGLAERHESSLGNEPQRSKRDERASVFLFDAAFGVSSGIDALDVTPIIAVGAFWQPVPRVAMGVASRIAVASSNVSDREGSATVATSEFVAGSRMYPLASGHLIEPSLGVGLSVIWIQIDGTEAESPYTLTSEPLVVAGPNVELGILCHLSRGFSLRSSLAATYAFPKPVIEFAGREVLSLGRPLVSWTLGIEFGAVSAASRD